MKSDESLLSPFYPGATVGKYRIVREIGRGGMGVVFLAEDAGLGRKVALKVLRALCLGDESDFYRRFRLEARAVAALYHPNIVRIHAFDNVAGQLVIEMEYVDGGSLSDYLTSTRPKPEHVASATRDVLKALSLCHNSGIVHRDVKPSNVLLDAHGIARLTDFGLAKAMSHHLQMSMDSVSTTGFFLGTPRFAPPEAWSGEEPTPAWDVYSVGALIYEAFSGGPVYEASNPLVLVKQLNSPPVPLIERAPAISAGLNDAVAEMLAIDPREAPV